MEYDYLAEITGHLTERCTTTDRLELELQELAEIYSAEEMPAEHAKLLANKHFQNSTTGEWAKFISQMQSGDELWRYSSPHEDWERCMGSAGFAIVRAGKVIHVRQTRMN